MDEKAKRKIRTKTETGKRVDVMVVGDWGGL